MKFLIIFSKTNLRKILFVLLGAGIPMVVYYENKSHIGKDFPWNPFNTNGSSYKCFGDFDYRYMLNDSINGYYKQSLACGIPKFIKNRRHLYQYVSLGKLVEVSENEYYLLDTMYYSHPFLTPETYQLLDSIGKRFHQKLENTDLACAKFNLTSMLRTKASVEKLRKRNKNSIRNSAHLHGTTFDVSYKTFYLDGKLVNESSAKFLKDALIDAIWELKKKKLCWATYEYWQTCIHVVSRQ